MCLGQRLQDKLQQTIFPMCVVKNSIFLFLVRLANLLLPKSTNFAISNEIGIFYEQNMPFYTVLKNMFRFFRLIIRARPITSVNSLYVVRFYVWSKNSQISIGIVKMACFVHKRSQFHWKLQNLTRNRKIGNF